MAKIRLVVKPQQVVVESHGTGCTVRSVSDGEYIINTARVSYIRKESQQISEDEFFATIYLGGREYLVVSTKSEGFSDLWNAMLKTSR